MQVFKDAATLAVLILLALTVRIDVDGAPLEIDLNPPADAAESQAEVERPAAIELPATPAAMPAPAAGPVVEKKVERLLLLEANGQRFELLLDGDEIVIPKRPTPAAEPCRDLFARRLES